MACNLKILSCTSISVFILLLYTFPFIKVVQRENECQMTYMYLHPQFIQLFTEEDANSSEFDRYRLMAYAEGKIPRPGEKLKFNGVPVLFIPGHGGSYRQARSIATMVQRSSSSSVFHFDFFSIDFSGEYNGLYGGSLIWQTAYIRMNIKRISELYKDYREERSVILIAHSMGGIATLGLFALSDLPVNSIRLIITLATPYNPIIMLDHHLLFFYNNGIHYNWEIRALHKNWIEKNMTLISIGSGFSDLQVRPGLTYTKYADLNVVTSAIPGVGISTDHICILWCKNFLKVLARALYDSVNIEHKGVDKDKSTVLSVFDYHLIQTTNGKHWPMKNGHEEILYLDAYMSRGKDLTNPFGLYLLKTRVLVDCYILINLTAMPHDRLFIRATNVKQQNWIAACAASSSPRFNHTFCEQAENLSKKGRTGYGGDYNTKLIHVDRDHLLKKGNTHIVVLIGATEDPVVIEYESYSILERNVEINPRLEQPIIENVNLSIFHRIEFSVIPYDWEVFDVRVTRSADCKSRFSTLIIFQVPWSKSHPYKIFDFENPEPFSIVLENMNPVDDKSKLKLVFYLGSECSYNATIEYNWSHTFVLLAVKHVPALIIQAAVLLLSTIAYQSWKMSKNPTCPTIRQAFTDFSFIGTLVFTQRCLSVLSRGVDMWRVLQFPNNDFFQSSSDLMEDNIVFLYAFTFAYAIIFLITFLMDNMVRIGGLIWNKANLRDAFEMYNSQNEEWFGTTINVDIAYVILSMIIASTGIGLIVGSLYYFAMICKVYGEIVNLKKIKSQNRDYLYRAVGSRKNTAKDRVRPADIRHHLTRIESVIHFHSPFFLYWCLITLWNFPNAVAWLNDIRIVPLPVDVPREFWIFALSTSMIWQMQKIPEEQYIRDRYCLISYLIFVVAVLLPVVVQKNICHILQFSFPAIVTLATEQYFSYNYKEPTNR